MRISCRSDIVIKESDFNKLMYLYGNADTDFARTLMEELAYANIVEDRHYPKNAVCMGALVSYLDMASNKRNQIRLVYADQANVEEMKISVLSPVGTALIGLKKNCLINWKMPNKKYAKFKIESVEQGESE